MTTPPMVTIWPSYTNQEDAMTTPTPSDYWINECIKIAASAGNLDAAENARRDLAALKAELASVKAERDALKNLLAECETTLAHARVFIGTREKMHPDGQFLYDELLAQVRAQCAAHPRTP